MDRGYRASDAGTAHEYSESLNGSPQDQIDDAQISEPALYFMTRMKTSKVHFQNDAGQKLVGLLDEPDTGRAKAYALFSHCFTCGKSLTSMKRIATQLTEEGIGLLRFDFTGLGESSGVFARTTFTTNLRDLRSAAAYLASERQAPSVLIGHSLGGAAALAVAPDIASVRCIATIGAPSDPMHVRNLLTGATFDNNGEAKVSIGGRPFLLGESFVSDLEAHDLPAIISQLGRPVLVFHSPVDAVVGIENSERIFTAAKHPRSFVSLGQADHLLSDERDARFVGHVLAAWAARYFA